MRHLVGGSQDDAVKIDQHDRDHHQLHSRVDVNTGHQRIVFSAAEGRQRSDAGPKRAACDRKIRNFHRASAPARPASRSACGLPGSSGQRTRHGAVAHEPADALYRYRRATGQPAPVAGGKALQPLFAEPQPDIIISHRRPDDRAQRPDHDGQLSDIRRCRSETRPEA